MSGSSLSATLALILKDDVSKPARSVAQALKDTEARVKDVAKAMAGDVGPTQKFISTLGKLKASSKDVEAVSAAWRDYAKAQKLAAESSQWTEQQIAGVQNWERQTISAIRAVEAERQREFQSQKRLIDQSEQQLRAQQQQQSRAGVGHYALGAAAGYVSAHAVATGIEDAIKAGAKYQHELVQLQNVGRTPAELAAIDKASRETVNQVPTTTYSENAKTIAETTNAFGTLNHAIENLTFVQKTASVLHAMAGDKIQGDSAEMGRLYAKFFEMRGTAGNVELFRKEGDEMTRAMVATGGVFNPQEMFNFAQQAKTALQGYNLRFISKIAPSIIGEIGGERAGTGAAAFDKIIMGTVSDKKQAQEWVRLGLIDPKMVNEGKGGVISWKPGAVHGSKDDPNLPHHDPMQWFHDVVLPAWKAKGIDANDKDAVLKELNLMFRKATANMWASEFALPANIQRLNNDEANTNKVLSPDEIYQNYLKNDPSTAVTALKDSIDNLMTAVSGPAMQTIASGLTTLAKGINAISDALKDYPKLAVKGGIGLAAAGLGSSGYLSYKLMTGFGLSHSAAALDRAAVALTASAEKIGAAGAVGGLPGAGPKGGGMGWLKWLSLIGGAAGAAYQVSQQPTVGSKDWADSTNDLNHVFDKLAKDWLPKGWSRPAEDVQPFEIRSPNAAPRVGMSMPPAGQGGAAPTRAGLPYLQSPDLQGIGNEPVRLSVDNSALEQTRAKAAEAKSVVNSLAEPVTPNVDSRALDAFIAQNTQAKAPVGVAPTRADLPYLQSPDLQGIGNEPVRLNVDNSALEQARAKAAEAKAVVNSLAETVTPNVDSRSLDAFIAKIAQAKAALSSLGSAGFNASLPSLGGVTKGGFSTQGVNGQ